MLPLDNHWYFSRTLYQQKDDYSFATCYFVPNAYQMRKLYKNIIEEYNTLTILSLSWYYSATSSAMRFRDPRYVVLLNKECERTAYNPRVRVLSGSGKLCARWAVFMDTDNYGHVTDRDSGWRSCLKPVIRHPRRVRWTFVPAYNTFPKHVRAVKDYIETFRRNCGDERQ